MPSTSKSQQRLFGMALACKRGAKDCPAKIQKLADSMSEEELEKYAKTSHEDLPEKVKESFQVIFALYAELLEAENELENIDINEADRIGSPELFDGKLTYRDQFKNGKSLSETLASVLGLEINPKAGGAEDFGFDNIALYNVETGETILEDALSGAYTFEDIVDALKVHFKIEESEVNEGKTIKVDAEKGKELKDAPAEKATGKLSDAKKEKPTQSAVPTAKSGVEGGKNDILQPKGKGISNAKTVPAADDKQGIKKDAPPAVDNKKDEKDASFIQPPPGVEKAEKNVMGNVYTPSIHKFPMGKAKNERRVFDFKDFLKIINYKTQDGIVQDGHGQNLTSNDGE